METMLIKNKVGRVVRVAKAHGVRLIGKEGATLIIEAPVEAVKEAPIKEVIRVVDKSTAKKKKK